MAQAVGGMEVQCMFLIFLVAVKPSRINYLALFFLRGMGQVCCSSEPGVYNFAAWKLKAFDYELDAALADETDLFVEPGLDITEQPPNMIFTVIIVKSRACHKVGLEICRYRGTSLLVKQVKAGLVKAWNNEHPSEQVRCGDCITAVNGLKGNADSLLAVIAQSRVLQFEISRQEMRVLSVIQSSDT